MIKNNKLEIILTVRNITHYKKFENVNIPTFLYNGKEKIKYGQKILIDVSMLKNGSDQKIEVCCDGCGSIIYKKYNNFIRDRKKNGDKDFCGNCGRKNFGKSKRLIFSEVCEYFIERKLIPLFTENDYKSVGSKLKCKCTSHEYILCISYNNLKNSEFPCKKCAPNNRGGYNKLKSKEIYKSFQDKGLIPLFSENVNITTKDKLPFLCKIHGVQYISYNQLKFTKYGCKNCLNRKGENSHNWKGGITPLVRNMRLKLNNWKKTKLKNNNYTCEITGIIGDKLVVHHITNFYIILEETLNLLNLDIKPIIGDYTDKELELIKEKLLELHDKHMSVVICKDLHELFHKKYGIKNNNEEQYKEFIIRYKSGEFNNKLPFKYRIINNPGVIK